MSTKTYTANAHASEYSPCVCFPPAAPCKIVLDPFSADRATIALHGGKKILNTIPAFLMMDVFTNPGFTTDTVMSSG